MFNLLSIVCPDFSCHWYPLLTALQTLPHHVISYHHVHMRGELRTIDAEPQLIAVKCLHRMQVLVSLIAEGGV